MKRVLAILLTLVLLMFTFGAYAAESGNTVKPGDTISVTFSFTSPGIGAFTAKIDYPSELEYVSAKAEGNGLCQGGPSGWSIASTSPVTSGSCTFTFKVSAEAADGVYPVTLNVVRSVATDYKTVVDYTLNASKQQVIVGEHTHSEETIPGKEATCTEPGLTEGKKCASCGDILVKQEVIPATDHVEEILPAVPATCTETGLTEGKKCSVCGEPIAAQEVVPALGHSYGEWTTIADPENSNCHSKTCSVCGDIVEEAAVPAEGAFPFNPEKAPTCTEDGEFYCSICGGTYATMSATGHSEEILPAVPATCAKAGLTEGKKCSVCGDILVKQDEVPALDHTEEILPAVPATCTETGLTEGKKCSVCGEPIVAQEVVPALDHTEEILPAVPATCTETGLTEGKKCSVCGEPIVAQEVVPALGHSWVVVEAKDPTYTEPGNTEGKECSVCGEIEGVEEIPALTPDQDPAYTIEKVSDTRGKVTYVENEASKPLDEVYVKITWRYTLSNGDTISVTLVRNVKEDGTFKLTGVSVPSDSKLDYVYVEVTDEVDADEMDRGAYDTFGTAEL